MNERTQIAEAFIKAVEQDAAERSQFLAALRDTDPDVAAEVEALLRAHERDGILDSPARLPDEAPVERRIGPYRVLGELGRGGMGVVYLAERDDGEFQRRVAVKILASATDADELDRRFRAERQILATLDHPNIAQLIDGGVTSGRLPYLVMEYVDGLPITEYCERHGLSVRERLQLFIDVCAAVDHAHRNLVLHRDLKPGNILVTAQRQVKLLDFGIAKLLNPALSAVVSPPTRAAQRRLTPEYASPEQLRDEPLSTTSDIYSLGVILHELLTGARPLNNESPDKISDGDLNAIVSMALRPEPSRRYGSAELLAQDLENYLQGLPVNAQRGSGWYRARKLARRHWLAASALGIALVSVIAGGAVAWRQSVAAHRERDRAQQALVESQRISEFLIGLFEVNDPAQLRGRAVTAQELLQRGRQQAEELRDQPLLQARMLEVIGRVYHATAQYGEARGLLERALSIREAHLGPDHLDVAETLTALSQTLRMQSRYVEADAAARRALDIRLNSLGEGHPDVAASLLVASTMAVFLADLDRALDLSRRAVTVLDNLPGQDSALAAALLTYGSTLRRRADYAAAEQQVRRAIEINRRIRAEHPQLAGSLMGLAYLAGEFPERAEEADSLYRQGIEMRRRTLGPDHPWYAAALGDYAIFLTRVGRADDALRVAQQHYTLVQSIYGAEHPRTAEVMMTYAQALAAVGRKAEAIALARQSVELRLERLGRVHNSTAIGKSHLAKLLHDNGQTAEALPLMVESIEILRNTSGGAETGLVGLHYAELGKMQMEAGRFVDAEQSLQQALRIYQQGGIPPSHQDHQFLLKTFVQLYEAWGRPQEAGRYRASLIR